MMKALAVAAVLASVPASAQAACAYADRLINDGDYAVRELANNADFIGFAQRGEDVVDETGTRQTLLVLTSLKGEADPILLPAYITADGSLFAGSSVQDANISVGQIGFFALRRSADTFARSECLDVALHAGDRVDRIRRLYLHLSAQAAGNQQVDF